MGKMIPNSRPQQSRAETEAIFRAHGMEPGDKVMMLAVRGYYLDSMGKPGVNDHGIYDDAYFVLAPGVHESFNFNTDPQKVNAKHAKLKPQIIKYAKGKHKGKYWALRPSPEGVKLECTRDGVTSWCSLTNIHEGGEWNTYSEGCMTLPPDQHDEARDLAYGLMDKYGQKTADVLLIENR